MEIMRQTRKKSNHVRDFRLRQQQIITFLDDRELEFGDEIGLRLRKAIKESRISIVVFSLEILHILHGALMNLSLYTSLRSKKTQLVCPIFYKVDPLDVRHHNESYGEAMVVHETRFGQKSENVKKH
ncbi:TMV resistance protein N [Glycine max]|nr:TMV resistance protein N [Glycine max]